MPTSVGASSASRSTSHAATPLRVQYLRGEGGGGTSTGADLAIEAVALTGFVLAGNTLLRPLLNAINRAPIKENETEAIYEVRITTTANHIDEGRELLRSRLESTNYPFQNIEIVERERDEIEVVATLVGTTANPHELDGIVSRIEQDPVVQSASWSLRTAE